MHAVTLAAIALVAVLQFSSIIKTSGGVHKALEASESKTENRNPLEMGNIEDLPQPLSRRDTILHRGQKLPDNKYNAWKLENQELQGHHFDNTENVALYDPWQADSIKPLRQKRLKKGNKGQKKWKKKGGKKCRGRSCNKQKTPKPKPKPKPGPKKCRGRNCKNPNPNRGRTTPGRFRQLINGARRWGSAPGQQQQHGGYDNNDGGYNNNDGGYNNNDGGNNNNDGGYNNGGNGKKDSSDGSLLVLSLLIGVGISFGCGMCCIEKDKEHGNNKMANPPNITIQPVPNFSPGMPPAGSPSANHMPSPTGL